MISLHRFNGQEFVLNCDHIESIEATPDTMIMLVSERKIVVKERVEEVVAKVIAFRRECGSGVRVMNSSGSAERE